MGDIILYLYRIQKVLTAFGVRSVRLRPHPSENRNWYTKYFDPNFFKLNPYDLETSMKKATLVIGPSSTVFIESSLLWSKLRCI